tara:strand:- start:2 stop:1051 length:1050 start_codon:yes stop_codon:yes gene_type:complete
MAPLTIPKAKLKKAKADIGTSKKISDAITPPNIPAEELVYQRSRNRQPIPHPEAHGGMLRNPDLHHIIGKKLRHAFLQKALQLDPAGGAAKLTQTDNLWRLQAGSGYKGLLPMDLHAHRPGHALGRSRGIEPWGKTLDTLNAKIANASSMDELLSTYGGYIKNHVIPELAHQRSMQGGYEKAGAVGGKVPQNELAELADLWAAQNTSLREHKKNKAHRQGVPSPEAMEEWDILNSANYSPFMTPTQLPKAGPQEKVKLPDNSTQRSEKPIIKAKQQEKVSVNPQLPVTPRKRLDKPVMEAKPNHALQTLEQMQEQMMNRNPGEGLATLLKILGGASRWVFSDMLRGAMP